MSKAREIQCNNELARKFAVVLHALEINVKRVTVLGVWIHIDSYEKYDGLLRRCLHAAGFDVVSASTGVHLDETYGYRIVGKVRQ